MLKNNNIIISNSVNIILIECLVIYCGDLMNRYRIQRRNIQIRFIFNDKCQFKSIVRKKRERKVKMHKWPFPYILILNYIFCFVLFFISVLFVHRQYQGVVLCCVCVMNGSSQIIFAADC